MAQMYSPSCISIVLCNLGSIELYEALALSAYVSLSKSVNLILIAPLSYNGTLAIRKHPVANHVFGPRCIAACNHAGNPYIYLVVLV